METVDYGDTDYRAVMGDDSKNYDYESKSLGAAGYQKQEFDDETGEIVSSEEDEFEEESYEEDFAADDHV